jgi:hypothetical protein
MRPHDRNPEPIISPDGRYLWDGQRWQPHEPDAATSHENMQVNSAGEWEPADPDWVVGAPRKAPSDLLALATRKSLEGQWDEVGSICRRLLRLDPGSVMGRWILAEAFLNQELPDDAIPLLDSLIHESGMTVDRLMGMSNDIGAAYRMKGDPLAGLRIMRAIDVTNAPTDDRLRDWVISRAIIAFEANEETAALADLEWVEQTWPGAGGVATLKAKMLSGELRGVVGPGRRGHSPSVTRCPVCGAPRRAASVIVCQYCRTTF